MIILARHGKTFNEEEAPVWIGARTDMPLTLEGKEQARQVAKWLLSHSLQPVRITAGPLSRTRDFAEIIATPFNIAVQVDGRLQEIDYGLWEGLSSEQIRTKFGVDELEAREQNSRVPEKAQWPETETQVRARITEMLDSYREVGREGSVLLCTSNGILKVLRTIIDGMPIGREGKVATGNLCQLEVTERGYRIITWNAAPLLSVG